MARIRPRNRLAIEIPIAAMADVAFLLIVFFIITTSFQRPGRLPVELPAEKQAESDQPPSNIPTVRVGTRGLFLNGASTEIWQLAPDLAVLLADKTRPQDRLVLLSADGPVEMERIVEVMDVIRACDAAVAYLKSEDE